MRLEQQALAAAARHQKTELVGMLHDAMERIAATSRAQSWGASLAASALASARDSVASDDKASKPLDLDADNSTVLCDCLSADLTGFLATPRPKPKPVPGVPRLHHPKILIDDELKKLMGGISSESSFARRVDLDLKQYVLEVRGMRFDSRVEGLDDTRPGGHILGGEPVEQRFAGLVAEHRHQVASLAAHGWVAWIARREERHEHRQGVNASAG
jgi:hypothetical protein